MTPEMTRLRQLDIARRRGAGVESASEMAAAPAADPIQDDGDEEQTLLAENWAVSHIAQHAGSPEVRQALASSFAEFFRAHDPQFDPGSFQQACHLNGRRVDEHDLIPAP